MTAVHSKSAAASISFRDDCSICIDVDLGMSLMWALMPRSQVTAGVFSYPDDGCDGTRVLAALTWDN